jgi:uncharacterized FlaG/YvyC family protein
MNASTVNTAERAAPAVALTRQIDPAQEATTAYGQLENLRNSYFSPVIRIDAETNRAVLQFRDPETGKVLRQYPPSTAGAYKKSAEDAEKGGNPAKHAVDTIEAAVVSSSAKSAETSVVNASKSSGTKLDA